MFSLFRFINNLSTGIPVMYCLLEVVSVCQDKLAPRFADKIDWIKVSILSNLDFYLNVGWWSLYIEIYYAVIKKYQHHKTFFPIS